MFREGVLTRVVVVGAGVGGLSTAALLAAAGLDVTVLEAEVYPGGCAGTFFHKRYRFDAGATLAAGFYPGGPMDLLARALGIEWPAFPAPTAMVVHLPGAGPIPVCTNPREWAEMRRVHFGKSGEDFWRWQEATARTVWDLALRLPPWPPRSPRDLTRLAAIGLPVLGRRIGASAGLALDAVTPVARHLSNASPTLKHFVDAQLMISAQTTSEYANALYGAAALDMPRRGVVHLAGGMGAIAQTLADAVRHHGGRVVYRREATRIVIEHGRPVVVETRKGESYPADLVVMDLTPGNAAALLDPDECVDPAPSPPGPEDGWGGFVMYVGIDGAALPKGLPLHHQVVVREPLGEGDSVFVSLSPEEEIFRAPAGKRAVTLSTHVDLRPWWRLATNDSERYERRKEEYVRRLMEATEVAIPGFGRSVELRLPGTPVTFEKFTRRKWGWVGGYPLRNLMRFCSTGIAPGVWLVGDSIFPGQSTAAVALGGMRVARDMLADTNGP